MTARLNLAEIVELVLDHSFKGFTGTRCGKCGKTANVVLGREWGCTCGSTNHAPDSQWRPPHENPNVGPTSILIQQAFAKVASGGG